MEWCQAFYQKYLSAVMLCAFRWATPNQITAFNLFFTIGAGVACFSHGGYWWNMAGLVVLLINGALDYLDGDLAKTRKMGSALGLWLDSGCDMLIQTAIMAAIAYSVLIQTKSEGYPLQTAVMMVFFIATNAMQVISLRYNSTFGFDSHTGNALFRKYMNTKRTLFNRFMMNMIDPTASPAGFVFFTFRYWLVAGILLNQLRWVFVIITAILVCRALAMYVIFAMHLAEYKKLWILQALALIDDEREEYYKCRMK